MRFEECNNVVRGLCPKRKLCEGWSIVGIPVEDSHYCVGRINWLILLWLRLATNTLALRGRGGVLGCGDEFARGLLFVDPLGRPGLLRTVIAGRGIGGAVLTSLLLLVDAYLCGLVRNAAFARSQCVLATGQSRLHAGCSPLQLMHAGGISPWVAGQIVSLGCSSAPHRPHFAADVQNLAICPNLWHL